MPRLKFLPAGACPTIDPRAGGQAPAAAAGLGEATGLAAGLAATAAAAGLAAGEAGAATGAAGEAGADGFGASVGLASVLAGAVGATAVDGDGGRAAARGRDPRRLAALERRVENHRIAGGEVARRERIGELARVELRLVMGMRIDAGDVAHR